MTTVDNLFNLSLSIVLQQQLKPSVASIFNVLDLSSKIPIANFIHSRQNEGLDPFNDIKYTLGETCPDNCKNKFRRLVFLKNIFTDSYSLLATICNEHNPFFQKCFLNKSLKVQNIKSSYSLSIPFHFRKTGTVNSDIFFNDSLSTSQLINNSTYLSLEPFSLNTIETRFVLGFDPNDLILLSTASNSHIIITPHFNNGWTLPDIDVWINNSLRFNRFNL